MKLQQEEGVRVKEVTNQAKDYQTILVFFLLKMCEVANCRWP